MATTTGGGTTTSMGNTPQAMDDLFTSAATGITEDFAGTFTLDVMANDLGGKAKTLYSVDNGAEIGDASAYSDLLDKDAVGSVQTTKLGAEITITAEGKITYHITSAMNLQGLADGEKVTDTFTYAIKLGNGTLSWATASVQILGTNDAPTVIALATAINEGAGTATVDALSGAADVDHNAVLHVVAPASLPDGVSFNASTNSFSLDANHATYNSLAQGETKTVTVSYNVSDEHGALTPNTVTFTITGTNDAPVAVADTNSGSEDATITGTVASNDTDVDKGATRTFALNAPVAGLTLNSDGTYTLDTTNAAYQHLAKNATTDVVASYTTTDDKGATSTSTLTITVAGVNDAPVAHADTNSGAEDATITGSVATNDTDVDDGATRTFALNAAAPAGLTFNADGSYSFNAANAAYQSLHEGETKTVVAAYTVTDNHGATSTANLTITITGTNDAPTVDAALTSGVAEGGSVTINALAGAHDLDNGAVLHAVAPAILPAGVTFSGDSITLDANNAAYNHLAAGVTETVTVSYGVTDAIATTANTATFTVTGTNDAPTVDAALTSGVAEGGSVTINALAGAHDLDDGAVLHAVAPASLPAGVSFAGDSITLDANNAAYNHLAAGATQAVTVSYGVTDGIATTANTATFTITGTNDAPTVDASLASAVNEGISVTVNALTGAHDLDDGAVLHAVAPGSLPAGVTFSGDSITLDANNAAYNHLAAGVTETVTVSYGVTDGIATTANTATFNVTGVNDIASIGGVSTGDVTEDVIPLTAAGDLTIIDADDGQAHFGAQTVHGTYGDFALLENGHWSYTADNTLAAIQALNTGATLTDSFTAHSFDGTADQLVTVTIHGVNEPVVSDPNDYDNLVTATGGVTINGTTGADTLYGTTGNDTINGNNGADIIYGGAGNDIIHGNSQDDTIYAGSGNDTVFGDAQKDRIFGGSGNDVIDGGAGQDTLTGGLGADTFVFSALTDSDKNSAASDIITDFQHGVDKIDLHLIDANTVAAGDQAFAFVAAPHADTIANSVTWSESGGNTIIHIDVDGDTTPDMQIVLTGTGLGLTAGDIIL